MGQGTIVSEVGKGLYEIEIDEGSEQKAKRLEKLLIKEASLQALILDDIVAIQIAVAAFAAGAVLFDAAIADYVDAQKAGIEDEGLREEVIIQTKNIQILGTEQQAAEAAKVLHEAELIDTQESIAALNGFQAVRTQQAWCADYTIEADGVVATVEVPGESASVLIAPGAAAFADEYGLVSARPMMNSAQLYHSLALLPGWQKYKPTYRFATALTIWRDTDEMDLRLDAATSSAQGLDINQEEFLYRVPVEYMRCNSRAFEYLDKVLVEFVGQDWANPKVVGFETDPNRCGFGNLRYFYNLQIPRDGTETFPEVSQQTIYRSALYEPELYESLRDFNSGTQITVERRVDEGPWQETDDIDYNVDLSGVDFPVGYVYGWNYFINQLFPPYTGGSGAIINGPLFSIRFTQANVYESGAQTLGPITYNDAANDFENWLHWVDVNFYEYDWPEFGYQLLIDTLEIHEVRARLDEKVFFHAAFKVEQGQVTGYDLIDLMADVPSYPPFASSPATELEDYELEDYEPPL